MSISLRKSEPIVLFLHPRLVNTLDLPDSNPSFPGSELSLQEKKIRRKRSAHFKDFFSFSRYTIVFKYYAFCLVLMMLLRPLLVKKVACGLGKSDRFKSIYAALYFFPILTVLQAVGGGLLCELSPDDANKHTDKHTLASDLGESANGHGIIFALRIRALFKIIGRSVICKGCSLVALSLPYLTRLCWYH